MKTHKKDCIAYVSMKNFRFDFYDTTGLCTRSTDLLLKDEATAVEQAHTFLQWLPPSERTGGMSLWLGKVLLLKLDASGEAIPKSV